MTGNARTRLARKDRTEFDPSAVIAGGQAERDADHQGEGGRRRRDDQHDLAAEHHAAEHVAGELVAAEQVDLARSRLDGARQRVLHDRHLAQRIEGRDGRGEDRGEQPEEADGYPGYADAAVEKLAVEAELLLECEACAKHDHQAQPDRPEPGKYAEEDLETPDMFHPRRPY